MPKERPVELSEKDIQKEYEKSLYKLEEGLGYVHSFVPTPIGVIDTLAVDSELRAVVFEFKKPDVDVRHAFIQALDYYSYDVDNPPWLDAYMRRSKPDLLQPNEKLSDQVHLVLVAEEFRERFERAVRGAEPEVMLVEYSLHSTDTAKIQLIPRITLDTRVTPSRKLSIPKTIDDHFRNKNRRPLYEKGQNSVQRMTISSCVSVDIKLRPRICMS
jgi:hypothetical protein